MTALSGVPGEEIKGSEIFRLPIGSLLRYPMGPAIGRICDSPEEAEDGGSKVVLLDPAGFRFVWRYRSNEVYRWE